jgi:predicted nucleic acid-binding protein
MERTAADCGVLWSEEMQDGLLVDRRLRIVNPFDSNGDRAARRHRISWMKI